MRQLRWHARWGLLVAMAMAPMLSAQVTPHAAYVYPAGGRQGATFEVTVGGQFLTNANSAIISGAGVKATVLEYVKPLTQMQVNTLREQLKHLMEKRTAAGAGPAQQSGRRGAAQTASPTTWTAADQKLALQIREQLAQFMLKRANPALAEIVRLQVGISPDAAPGRRELRVAAQGGLTNPLVFCVGELPEYVQKRAGAGGDEAPLQNRNRTPGQSATPPRPATDVQLPVMLNGQAMPGTADRYRFQATKGQHLVVAATARELRPYIADAVPGWFQASLTLYDPSGKEVAAADHYLFHPDPVLHYEVPSDGQYTLAVRDSIYRGRADFVYRIAVGELPYLTGIFPLGGKVGSRTAVAEQGWNLPSNSRQKLKGKAEGLESVYVRKGELTSNTLPFAVDSLREYTDRGTIRKEHAQQLKIPVVVNGRIERAGSWDAFSFKGRAGEEIAAEIFARRLESPLDSILKLTDAAGRELASNDDYDDKGAGLVTHQADSRIVFKLPANGTYYLRVSDAQGRGGDEYAYRLRITDAQADFELRVVPSSINVRGGSSVPVTVYALRKDGFSGDIALRLSEAPHGFALEGSVIPAGQDKVRLTLTAPPGRMEKPHSLAIEGRASIGGRDVRRLAVPADDMMQAFAYHHLVPAKDLLVAVIGGGRAKAQWKASDEAVQIPVGGTARVQLEMRVRMAGQVQLALDEPPDGISIEKVSPVQDGVAILLRADAQKVKPGLRGNLIFDVFVERSVDSEAGTGQRRRQGIGVAPALPFEIVSTGSAR